MRKKTRWFLISIPKDAQITENQLKDALNRTMNELFGILSYLYSIKKVPILHQIHCVTKLHLGYLILYCNREIGSFARLCTTLANHSCEINVSFRIIHTSGTLCSIQRKLTDIISNEEILECTETKHNY